MLNRRKKQDLMRQIVELRRKRQAVDSELKQKMIDLYICMGVSTDQAVKMV